MNDLFKDLIGQLKAADGGSKVVAGLVAIAMVVAIGITAVVSNKPDFQSAFTGLSAREHAAVSKALSEASIAFRVSQPPGPFTVFVDEGDRSAALAAAYSSGALDQPLKGILTDSGINTVFMGNAERSQLVQKRQFEEVEGMLEVLDSVVSATVRAAPVDHTPFSSSSEDRTSASVTVTMLGNRDLSLQEAMTIARLVSGALGIAEENLTIADQAGNTPYTSGDADALNASQNLLSIKLEYDKRTADNVNRVLFEILGPDKARVTVSSEWDFEQSTTRTETPGKGGLLSESTTSSETPMPREEVPGGIGGLISPLDDLGGGDPAGDQKARPEVDTPVAITKEERKEYQPAVTTTQSVRAHEVLKRQSIALYLDESIPGDLLTTLEETIKTSVGYEESRDDFNRASLAFYAPPAEEEPAEGTGEAATSEEAPGSGFPMEMVLRRGVEIVTALVFIFLLLKSLKSGSRAASAGAEAAAAIASAEADVDPELLARMQVEELLKADPEKVGQILASWAREEEPTVGSRS